MGIKVFYAIIADRDGNRNRTARMDTDFTVASLIDKNEITISGVHGRNDLEIMQHRVTVVGEGHKQGVIPAVRTGIIKFYVTGDRVIIIAVFFYFGNVIKIGCFLFEERLFPERCADIGILTRFQVERRRYCADIVLLDESFIVFVIDVQRA